MAYRKTFKQPMSRARRQKYATARQMYLQMQGRRRAPLTQYRQRAGRTTQELKFLDCAWNAVTINSSTDGTSGAVQPSSGCTDAISVPAQGDGESQRDGRKYTIKSVWVSGQVQVAVATDKADSVVQEGTFFALVLDTQANGTTISSEKVYINPSTDAGGMLPQPLRNLQNSKRFRILASQYVEPKSTYGITDGASTGSLNAQVSPVFNLNWKGNIVCDSTGTSADVASASDNAIHVLAYTGDNSVFTHQFIGKSRVRFVG